jgi:hypothetical protein
MEEEIRNFPKGQRQSIITLPHPEFGHVQFINMSPRQKDVLAHYTVILDSKRDKQKI